MCIVWELSNTDSIAAHPNPYITALSYVLLDALKKIRNPRYRHTSSDIPEPSASIIKIADIVRRNAT
jgi:hypothetical protein